MLGDGASSPGLPTRASQVVTDQGKEFTGPTIIYCPSRKEVESVSEVLTNQEIDNRMYHAGLTMNQRKNAHKEFVFDSVQVIVATIAFGMGIDKPDVRNVINYGAPRDMEFLTALQALLKT